MSSETVSSDWKSILSFISICILVIVGCVILVAVFPADKSVTSVEGNNPITVIYESGKLEGSPDEVSVIHDDERKVTCWVFTRYYDVGGVDCLPDIDIVTSSTTSAESNNAPITIIYRSGKLGGPLDEAYIIHDDERQVTCWVFTNHYDIGGVDCIPDIKYEKPQLIRSGFFVYSL